MKQTKFFFCILLIGLGFSLYPVLSLADVPLRDYYGQDTVYTNPYRQSLGLMENEYTEVSRYSYARPNVTNTREYDSGSSP